MFYYAILLFALFHLFALPRTVRLRDTDENTKVLVYLSAAVAFSVPLLGLLGRTWPVTAALLAAALLLYALREKAAAFVTLPVGRWLRRYGAMRPYPCLAVSIVGLLGWAWYHP
jgi:hypothetical protein